MKLKELDYTICRELHIEQEDFAEEPSYEILQIIPGNGSSFKGAYFVK